MKILLTGATGFVGKALYAELKKAHEVYTIVRNNNIAYDYPIIWDFRNDFSINNLPPKIDTIIHLAQSKLYREFPEQAIDMFKVNVESTASLLDYAVKAKAQHFIFMSTGTVYEPFAGLLQEESPISPKHYYPVSKQISEQLVNCYSNQFKICILRAFFVYGPGQQDRLIPNLIQRIQNRLAISLECKNGMTLTPTYIDDLVKVIGESAAGGWQGTINVASPEKITIRKISELIAKHLKTPLILEETGQDFNHADSSMSINPQLLALEKLYPYPFVLFEEGLRRVFSEGNLNTN